METLMPFLIDPPGPFSRPDRSLALKLGAAGLLDRAMPQILCGPKLRGKDVRRANVSHILNVAQEVGGRQAAKRGGARYSKAGMSNDQSVGLPRAELLSAWAFARSALGDPMPPGSPPKGKRLLVHCQQGTHRSPAVAAFLLACLTGMTLEGAWSLVRTNYPSAERVPVYMQSCQAALDALRQMAVYADADGDGDGDYTNQDKGTGRPTRAPRGG
jgi:hypothetical protein